MACRPYRLIGAGAPRTFIMPIGPRNTRKGQSEEPAGESLSEGQGQRDPISLLPFTVLLLGLLSHRLLTEDLTGRHETEKLLVSRSARVQQTSRNDRLTGHHASFQVRACIPPGRWSSGGDSQCRRDWRKVGQAANAAESAVDNTISNERVDTKWKCKTK